MSEIKEQITYQRYKALEKDFNSVIKINTIYKTALDRINEYLKRINNQNIGYWIEDENGVDIFIDVKDDIYDILKTVELTINSDK
jgi:hypothetical protein